MITLRELLQASALVVTLSATTGAYAAVTISASPTQNMSCASGVCTPTAKDAVLNASDLATMLASGNVQVNTGSKKIAPKVEDIVVSAGFDWASASSLTLDAWRSVTVDRPVADNGSGAVTLTANHGGGGGNLAFGSKGNLSFLGTSNSLTIDGEPFALENSVTSLASAIAANPAGNYALANSYDASVDGAYSESPIPTTVSGTVQGLGNAISHLSIEHGRGKIEVAMFDAVGTTGAIENLRLSKISYVDTNREYCAAYGLVVSNEGYLFGDTASGSITAKGDPNRGKSGAAAGLVGDNAPGGTIVSSSANVRLLTGYAGGLAAVNQGTISLSHADGDSEGGDVSSGGLVAINTGTISQSYATGSSVGGLVGGAGGTVSNSYATGAVGANGGGLVGETAAGNTIITSYATGMVASGSGGFACQWSPGQTATNDYWDTTTSGTTDGICGGNVAGITGLTTAQLQSGLPSGFDPTIWAENPKINGGFPYLINNPPPKK